MHKADAKGKIQFRCLPTKICSPTKVFWLSGCRSGLDGWKCTGDILIKPVRIFVFPTVFILPSIRDISIKVIRIPASLSFHSHMHLEDGVIDHRAHNLTNISVGLCTVIKVCHIYNNDIYIIIIFRFPLSMLYSQSSQYQLSHFLWPYCMCLFEENA